MCMNCGCGEVDERHGNDDNLVAEDVRRAASASGLDMSATVRNLEDSLRKLGGGMAASGAGSMGSTETGGYASRGQDASQR